MKVKHFDKEYEVYLEDDGTLDTIISVDGVDIRFDNCSWARRPNGEFYLSRFKALVGQAIEQYEDRQEVD